MKIIKQCLYTIAFSLLLPGLVSAQNEAPKQPDPETVKKGVPADQFGLPFPTTIIVDNRGVIRFVKTHLDYKVRVKPEEMLAIAKQIRVEMTPDK